MTFLVSKATAFMKGRALFMSSCSEERSCSSSVWLQWSGKDFLNKVSGKNLKLLTLPVRHPASGWLPLRPEQESGLAYGAVDQIGLEARPSHSLCNAAASHSDFLDGRCGPMPRSINITHRRRVLAQNPHRGLVVGFCHHRAADRGRLRRFGAPCERYDRGGWRVAFYCDSLSLVSGNARYRYGPEGRQHELPRQPR